MLGGFEHHMAYESIGLIINITQTLIVPGGLENDDCFKAPTSKACVGVCVCVCVSVQSIQKNCSNMFLFHGNYQFWVLHQS